MTNSKPGCMACLLKSVILLTFLLAVGFVVARHYFYVYSYPFFGRGSNIRFRQHEVVVGPVVPGKGIPGTLEIGMTRQQIQAQLGRPLIGYLTRKERDRIYANDIDGGEDAPGEFYGKCYAWVHRGNSGRVLWITFDLRALANRYTVKQIVKLSLGGKIFTISADNSQDDVVRMLSTQQKAYKIRIQGSSVILLGTGTSFEFDDDHGKKLQSIEIIGK